MNFILVQTILILAQTVTYLRHADNLSKTLQSSSISAAGGQKDSGLTLRTLEGIRSDDQFSLFWKLVLLKIRNLDISEPDHYPEKEKHLEDLRWDKVKHIFQ